jgi:hypothetical protein
VSVEQPLDLEDLRDQIALHLERLRVVLPDDYRLTLLGRNEALADADLIVTQDTQEGIAAVLRSLCPAAASPRSWHYVTEKLPEPGAALDFWTRDGSRHEGTYDPVRYIVSGDRDEPSDWKSVFNGYRYRNSSVYAWEPESTAPPLPEEVRHAE